MLPFLAQAVSDSSKGIEYVIAIVALVSFLFFLRFLQGS